MEKEALRKTIEKILKGRGEKDAAILHIIPEKSKHTIERVGIFESLKPDPDRSFNLYLVVKIRDELCYFGNSLIDKVEEIKQPEAANLLDNYENFSRFLCNIAREVKEVDFRHLESSCTLASFQQ